MKIKSLLLGSAAVMVAVSGARAADAIIIEPEPVEYVRVCDAYGAGWFYIPGTETCLRIHGLVYAAYGANNYHDDDDSISDHVSAFRGRLNVQANNETEYGTLASYIRMQGSAGGSSSSAGRTEHNDLLSGPYVGDPGVVLDKAYISLAGFTVGYLDNWWSRGLRFGYYNADVFDFANYGYQDSLALDYTYAGNGWTFSVGAEGGSKSGSDGAPDVYAGVTYTGGGFFIGGVYYHDSSADAGAWRVRADYDFGNGFRVGGWYQSDDGETDFVKGHQWGVTAAMSLTDSLVLWGGYNEYDDTFWDSALNVNALTDTGKSSWTVGLDWQIVNGLLMQLTYSGQVYDYEGVTVSCTNNAAPCLTSNGTNRNGGVWGIQVTRSF